MLKKLFALMVVLMMAFALVGCGGDTADTEENGDTATTEENGDVDDNGDVEEGDTEADANTADMEDTIAGVWIAPEDNEDAAMGEIEVTVDGDKATMAMGDETAKITLEGKMVDGVARFEVEGNDDIGVLEYDTDTDELVMKTEKADGSVEEDARFKRK